MLTFTCDYCEKRFQREKSQAYHNTDKSKRRTKNIFCSRECSHAHARKTITFNCTNCQKQSSTIISQFAKSINHFCSQSCSASYNNRQRECKPKEVREPCYKPKIGRPKLIKLPKLCPQCGVKSKSTFCSTECSIEYKFQQKVKLVEERGYFYEPHIYNCRPFVKKYLRKKHGDKCSICGHGSIWNGKPLVLVCDHINGVPNDWTISNIRLVCPHCDSQLPTFKSKNKGNGGRPR